MKEKGNTETSTQKTQPSCPKVRFVAKPSDISSLHLRPIIFAWLTFGFDSTPHTVSTAKPTQDASRNQLWANILFSFLLSFMVLVNILSEAVRCTTEGLKETAVWRELIWYSLRANVSGLAYIHNYTHTSTQRKIPFNSLTCGLIFILFITYC